MINYTFFECLNRWEAYAMTATAASASAAAGGGLTSIDRPTDQSINQLLSKLEMFWKICVYFLGFFVVVVILCCGKFGVAGCEKTNRTWLSFWICCNYKRVILINNNVYIGPSNIQIDWNHPPFKNIPYA